MCTPETLLKLSQLCALGVDLGFQCLSQKMLVQKIATVIKAIFMSQNELNFLK